MNAKVVFHHGALLQLAQIPSVIGERILEQMTRLAEFPRSCPKCRTRGLATRYRQLVVWPYCIIYRYDEKERVVRILHIGHGRQMPPSARSLMQEGNRDLDA